MNPLDNVPRVIALLGDSHADIRSTTQQIETAYLGGADVVMQLGDLTYDPTSDHNERFLSRINRTLKRLGLVLLFARGNHDDARKLAALGGDSVEPVKLINTVWHLPQACRWSWDGYVYGVLGGAVSVNKDQLIEGKGWWPEETISHADVERLTQGGPVDVLLTHDCPASDEFTIPGLAGPSRWPTSMLTEADAHRRLLRTAVDAVRPRHLFHGHFHQRYEATIDLGRAADRPDWDGQCHVHGLADNQSDPRTQLVFTRVDGSLIPRDTINESIAVAWTQLRESLPPGAEQTVEGAGGISRRLVYDALSTSTDDVSPHSDATARPVATER